MAADPCMAWYAWLQILAWPCSKLHMACDTSPLPSECSKVSLHVCSLVPICGSCLCRSYLHAGRSRALCAAVAERTCFDPRTPRHQPAIRLSPPGKVWTTQQLIARQRRAFAMALPRFQQPAPTAEQPGSSQCAEAGAGGGLARDAGSLPLQQSSPAGDVEHIKPSQRAKEGVGDGVVQQAACRMQQLAIHLAPVAGKVSPTARHATATMQPT